MKDLLGVPIEDEVEAEQFYDTRAGFQDARRARVYRFLDKQNQTAEGFCRTFAKYPKPNFQLPTPKGRCTNDSGRKPPQKRERPEDPHGSVWKVGVGSWELEA
jgi:hypothetical protein